MGEMGSSEALFSNKNNTLGSGSKVYTEDVGGSSPSSPTSQRPERIGHRRSGENKAAPGNAT